MPEEEYGTRLSMRLKKPQDVKLEELREKTGNTDSQIMRDALDAYHSQVFETSKPAASCGDGYIMIALPKDQEYNIHVRPKKPEQQQ